MTITDTMAQQRRLTTTSAWELDPTEQLVAQYDALASMRDHEVQRQIADRAAGEQISPGRYEGVRILDEQLDELAEVIERRQGHL